MIDKPGEVAEWSNALDLKSSDSKESVGSNPTLSVSVGEAGEAVLIPIPCFSLTLSNF